MNIAAEDPSYEAFPRFDPGRIGRTVDLLRANPMFQHVPGLKGKKAGEIAASLLNKLSDLRWPCCVNGCSHQCLICSVSAAAGVHRMALCDYLHLLENLKAVKEAAGLRFSFGLYDVAPHHDGDTMNMSPRNTPRIFRRHALGPIEKA